MYITNNLGGIKIIILLKQTTILKGETYLDSSNALLLVTFLRTLWSLVLALTLELLVSLRNGRQFCALSEFPCRMIFGPDEAEKFDLGIVPVSVVVLFRWLFGFILIFYGNIKYKSLVFWFSNRLNVERNSKNFHDTNVSKILKFYGIVKHKFTKICCNCFHF